MNAPNLNNYAFPPNGYNGCLIHELMLMRAINRKGGLYSICPGHRWADPPWVKMPPQGKRYFKINSIPLPGVEQTDFLVTSRRVPEGYDSCIVSTVNIYTGIGFLEGSGDIRWRIKRNEVYLKNMGNLTTSIGSLTTPYNINSGQYIAQTGNIVQYFVSLGPGALGNLNGGRIICALFGWDWPR
jgi:hypothetical protein